MGQKEYAILILFYEEGTPEIDNCIKRVRIAKTPEKAREILEQEYNKTIEYAKENGINTKDENEFDLYINTHDGNYEINADGYFYETGEIIEAETE